MTHFKPSFVTGAVTALSLAACFSVDFALNVDMNATASFAIDVSGDCSGSGRSEDGRTSWTKTQTEAGCRVDVQYDHLDFVPVEDIRQAIRDAGEDPKDIDITEMTAQIQAVRIHNGAGDAVVQPTLLTWFTELEIAGEAVLHLEGQNTSSLLDAAQNLPTDAIRDATNAALHGKADSVAANAIAMFTISDDELARWQTMSQPITMELDIHLQVTEGAKDAI